MEIIEQTPLKLVMRMPANDSLANAIRRSINEIPILAVDEVEIYKNDSALYDEFLAHRVGLVPLKTEASMNEKTEIEMKLSKAGPCMVLAEDLKGGAEIVHNSIPITLLEEDQELELVATARLGTAIEHEKYLSGLCYYRRLSEISSKNPAVTRLIEDSRGVIKPEKHKEGWLCDLSEHIAQEVEKIDVSCIKDSGEMVFVIESYGQMAAKDMLLKALRALGQNLDHFEKVVA
ncbi:MAG TPA: DNA-directed RNA polymerase subunit D [Candidatus Nanoarchaeia archaeon]|nr:DNA-directed RNA polymerase subunit D [Candidatus Nanoarchaeia archaeon]